MVKKIVELYDFHVWSNDVIFKRLKEIKFSHRYQTGEFSFSPIINQLNHIYFVDFMCFKIITTNSDDAFIEAEVQRQQLDAATLVQQEEAFRQLSDDYYRLIQGFSDKRLEEVIYINHPHAGLLHSSLMDIFLHVVTNGAYYRGMISSYLPKKGYPPTFHDYNMFLYSKTKV